MEIIRKSWSYWFRSMLSSYLECNWWVTFAFCLRRCGGDHLWMTIPIKKLKSDFPIGVSRPQCWQLYDCNFYFLKIPVIQYGSKLDVLVRVLNWYQPTYASEFNRDGIQIMHGSNQLRLLLWCRNQYCTLRNAVWWILRLAVNALSYKYWGLIDDVGRTG